MRTLSRDGPRRAAAVGAAILSLALAGCSTSGNQALCPPISVLRDAATLTRFAPGPGRDLLDVDYEAEVADILSACRYAKDDSGAPALVVAMAPIIVATRGPANREGKADFQYFVSIVDASQHILNKKVFDVAVAFPGNRSRVVVRDDDPPVSVDIPVQGGSSPSTYEILIGFQLSQDELDYNRRRATER